MKSDRIHAVLTANPLLLLLHLTPPRDSLHVNFRSQEEIALFFSNNCVFHPSEMCQVLPRILPATALESGSPLGQYFPT